MKISEALWDAACVLVPNDDTIKGAVFSCVAIHEATQNWEYSDTEKYFTEMFKPSEEDCSDAWLQIDGMGVFQNQCLRFIALSLARERALQEKV